MMKAIVVTFLCLYCMECNGQSFFASAQLAPQNEVDVLREMKSLKQIVESLNNDKVRLLDTIDELKAEIKEEKKKHKKQKDKPLNEKSSWFGGLFTPKEIRVEGCMGWVCCIQLLKDVFLQMLFQSLDLGYQVVKDPIGRVGEMWDEWSTNWAKISEMLGSVLILLILNAIAFCLLKIQDIGKGLLSGMKMIPNLPLVHLGIEISKALGRFMDPVFEKEEKSSPKEEKLQKELQEMKKMLKKMSEEKEERRKSATVIEYTPKDKEPMKPRRWRCNTCKTNDHPIWECPKGEKCKHCGKTNHKSENCWQKFGRPEGTRGRSASPSRSFTFETRKPRSRSPVRTQVASLSELSSSQGNDSS